MNSYEQKQEERRERLEAAAARARAESERRFKAGMGTARVMQGEPVKIGHHSEKRHRRDVARMDGHMSKSAELARKADELQRRAGAVGKGGISSDDPDAPEKIRERLVKLEAKRQIMKSLNAYYRKHGTCVGFPEISEAVAERFDREIPERYSWDRQPFPKWELTNLGANIRRLKKRLEELEARASFEAQPAVEGDGFRIVEDVEENRLRIFFDAKPPEDVRSKLKSFGFRWAPTVGAWQRQLNNAARHAARAALGVL